ncbi:SDR family oxidoreductase [Advenella sp. RU8]|uniref:SDR family oxidoreductase n=1 Tax=Advenella sp. RU8 TaxID=3399575 RepID=UPI003AAD44F1
MDLELTNKQALITGGSRGIGLASAIALAREGAHIHLVSGNAKTLEKAAADIKAQTGITAQTTALDLSRQESREQLAPVLEYTDILVNNAGAIPGGGFKEIDHATWLKAWDLKVHGYIELTRLALNVMTAKQSGVIINVIGAAGSNPRYEYLAGSTGNAALIAFTKAVGGYSSTAGVRVLGLNPGPTKTDRLLTLYKSRAQAKFNDPERWHELLDHLPFGRPAESAEIADIVTFLASARASYLTGLVIEADGGASFLK